MTPWCFSLDARARQRRRRLWAATVITVVAASAATLARSRLPENGSPALRVQPRGPRTRGIAAQAVPVRITYHIAPRASFRYLPHGWSTLPEAPSVLDRQGTTAESIVVNWRYAWNPTGPADALPSDGVMIWVGLFRSGPPAIDLCRTTQHFADHPARTIPLHLPRVTSGTLEGDPKVREYRVFGRYADSYDFEVRVDIAPHASPHAWQLAALVVAGIRLPTWPRPATC
jgi:hypothetical protein